MINKPKATLKTPAGSESVTLKTDNIRAIVTHYDGANVLDETEMPLYTARLLWHSLIGAKGWTWANV